MGKPTLSTKGLIVGGNLALATKGFIYNDIGLIIGTFEGDVAMISTLAEAVERIPTLYNKQTKQFGVSTNAIVNLCITAENIVLETLQPVYGDDLKLANPRFSLPLVATDEDDDWGTGHLLRLSDGTVEPTTDTEPIIVEMTSTTEFKVTGWISGALGTGDTSTLFTASDNSFTIAIADWTAIESTLGKKFVFSRTWYEPTLVLLSSFWVAHHILASRYVTEGANDLDFENNVYTKEFNNLLMNLLNPEYPLQLKAPNASYDANFTEDMDWKEGYDINQFGLLNT